MTLFALTPGAMPDGESIVALDLAKRHIGIDVTDDSFDDLVGSYRDSAIDLVSNYTMKALAPTDYTWRGRVPDDLGAIMAGVGPVTAITGASFIDANGDSQTFAHADLLIGPRDRLILKPGKSWPSTADIDGALTISFSAGYAAGEVPRALVQAALFMTGHLFQNREPLGDKSNVTELPLTFTRLCHAYRTPIV